MTNRSLQKKTAARMSAVQSLYQGAITKDAATPGEQAARVKAQLSGNQEEQKTHIGMAIEPDYKMLETLLTGIAEHHAEIQLRLGGALTPEWKQDRMGPLLVALLECAIFEMFFYKGTKPTIVIDEYTRLARSFFAEKEVGFVHGALHTLARQYG